MSNHVSGAKLFAMVHSLRRRGVTASFGADVDPKRKQQKR